MADENRDFTFHWDGGSNEWGDLFVVRFDLDERISAPFEARILLQSHDPEAALDPYDLVQKLGTLRILTRVVPAVRCLHGIIASAEDRGPTRIGALYEIVLQPPVVRAMHRKRSRIFLEKTTKEIVEAVLTGDPKLSGADPKAEPLDHLTDPFCVPEEHFAWRVKDPTRIEDVKARPFVVQYEESDFAFISRLLEAEGISYHFEHTEKAVVFVMTDHDEGRQKLDPREPLGPSILGRHLERVRVGARMRPSRVTLVEYNWTKPKLDMRAESDASESDLFVQSYPGAYVESPDHGAPLAKAKLERFLTEARWATAEGSTRVLGAGSVFTLEHSVARYSGEFLVSHARSIGVSAGELTADQTDVVQLPLGEPFRVEVELVRRGSADRVEESKFRPAIETPKPRILSTQTATVTDEPSTRGAEIHVGGPEGNENGSVRLRFHWDTDTARHDKEPTSCWVRVSQVFAGAGGGAVFHPRVGTEVIVSYDDGDPDRPIVVGRVYNGIQPASAEGKGAATVSTLKSLASPGGKVFNELSFDDTAGKEKVSLTAGKDWNSEVGNDRTEHVTNNSGSTVDVDRSEDTGANRKTSVGADNSETVSGSETVSITGSQTMNVGVDQNVGVGANQTTGVGGSRGISVGASQHVSIASTHSVSVGASETYTVGATQDVTVGAVKTESIGAALNLSVGATMTVAVGAIHSRSAPVDITNSPSHIVNSTETAINASAKALIQSALIELLAGGEVTIQAATVNVAAGGELNLSGGTVNIKGGSVSVEGGAVKIAGGVTDITGGVVGVN